MNDPRISNACGCGRVLGPLAKDGKCVYCQPKTDSTVATLDDLPQKLRDDKCPNHDCNYHDVKMERAADEIERLRKAINDAIDYCYRFEREHEAGHPGMGALIPIQQDLQAAVGR